MTDINCKSCYGFGVYPLGRLNTHICFRCKGSGLIDGYVSILPWEHPAYQAWFRALPRHEIMPNFRKTMNIPPPPKYDPKIHGADRLPPRFKSSYDDLKAKYGF